MKLYLAGPMTGLPELNYPAFHAAAAALRALGHVVVNPAENPVPPCGGTWVGYMRISVKQLADVEAVVMLPDWQSSPGALLEHRLAMDLKMVAYPLSCIKAIPP